MAYGLPQGGQRIVVADKASRVTGREIVVPGMRSDPDVPPGGKYDREFDRPLTAGDLVMGTLAAKDANTSIPSHLYLAVTQTGAHNNAGIYWPAPPAPFWVTAKLSSWTGSMNSTTALQFCGIFVGEPTPGKFATCEVQTSGSAATSRMASYLWTNPTTFSSSLAASVFANGWSHAPSWYLRIKVTSSTSIAVEVSRDGRLFSPLGTGLNPSLSSVGSFGCFLNGFNTDLKAAFDWIRLTDTSGRPL